MPEGVPYIAFHFEEGDDALHMTLLDRGRLARGLVVEDTFGTLKSFNERGLEESAIMIGKMVLGVLQRSNIEKFAAYPNLIIETRQLSPERKAAILAETEVKVDDQEKDDEA